MRLSEGQKAVMASDKNLLVIGGPGSGKTTISILKASEMAQREIAPGQKILFLSFARATVTRVAEAIDAEKSIPAEYKALIEVETYHSFFWKILKTHGYLIGLPRRLTLLTPAGEAVAMSEVRSAFPIRSLTEDQKSAKRDAESIQRTRLANEDGKVCFDLYAPYVGKILEGSVKIRALISTRYPIIILDEFQDTNAAQWSVVKALGEFSRLISLADPEQRIYDWIGADPARLDQFKEIFHPDVIDLSTDNHRSRGTDIAVFGNDILKGQFSQSSYEGIDIATFEAFSAPAVTTLITTLYAARSRLVTAKIKDWSIAVLVPTKKLTRLVSDALRSPPAGLNWIPHSAAVEMEAPILGAELIAHLLQRQNQPNHFSLFIDLLCNYFLGKGGGDPTQTALKEASTIRRSYEENIQREAEGRALRQRNVLVNTISVYNKIGTLSLVGDPDTDWKLVRETLAEGACSRLKEIANEVRNVRLLERGSQLRQDLAQDWRENGLYRNALDIVRLAFVKDHFSTNTRPESGVVVMNMHKAKGKQFDEVVIFEGWPIYRKGQPPFNGDRIVRFNSREMADSQSRQNFRVSITRGKRRTTILTPKVDPCVLLIP